MQRARLAAEAGSFATAELLLKDYVSQSDASPEGEYLLGYILYREVKPKESIAEYAMGFKLRPPTATDLKVLGLDYVLLNDLPDADRWLTRAVALSSRDVKGWYYLGRTKYGENRFAEAVDAFLNCLKLDPHNEKAEANLGLSYQGLNQLPKAMQALHNAIDWQAAGSDPDPQPFLSLGSLLNLQEQAADGLPYLLKATELAPHNAKAHEELGRAYLQLLRFKDAQAELERAIQLAPNSSSLHFELGTDYRKQGLKDKAKKEFDRCAELIGSHSAVDTPND